MTLLQHPCPAARQINIAILLVLLRFSGLKCKPNGQKNVVELENLIIESLNMIDTEFKLICTSNGEGLNGVP